jgi:AraC-like DNA-binding protein
MHTSKQPEKRQHVSVFEVSDPIAAGETIQVIGQDLVHLGPGPFHLYRVTIQLPDVTLIYHSNKSRTRVNFQLDHNQMGFSVSGSDSKELIGGVDTKASGLFVAGPGAGAEMVVEQGYQSIVTLMEPDFIQKQFDGYRWDDVFRMPSGIETSQVDAKETSLYFDLGKRLTQAAESNRHIFDDDVTARMTAQRDIVDTFMPIFASGSPRRLEPRERTRNTYSDLVKSCENFTLDAGPERLSITDLCNNAGTSERTLQYAFREIMGMSPLAYLKRLRLHRARRDFYHAKDPQVSVTEIAMRWGFWHLGEFSRDYKACFGELPSDSLKQRLA